MSIPLESNGSPTGEEHLCCLELNKFLGDFGVLGVGDACQSHGSGPIHVRLIRNTNIQHAKVFEC
ncbi:hypothetical protein BGZ91_012219 [Linnemannia elongata]|nr:hypothetical protein BGZ91_012219 [Linnemannia elongata]